MLNKGLWCRLRFRSPITTGRLLALAVFSMRRSYWTSSIFYTLKRITFSSRIIISVYVGLLSIPIFCACCSGLLLYQKNSQ
jgi:hypothetical protein